MPKSRLENYRFDISKHAKGAEKQKVRACYDAIPKQLVKELKEFQYSTVEKGKTSKKYGGSVPWLMVNRYGENVAPFADELSDITATQRKMLEDLGVSV